MTRLNVMSAAVLAVGVLATTSACATGYGYGDRGSYGQYGGYGDRGGYRNDGYYREVERRPFDNGFREGLRAGERDGRSRRRYDPARHDDWRDANDGYRREYGDHNFYRRTFRSGFETGYAQGYGRYGRTYRRY